MNALSTKFPGIDYDSRLLFCELTLADPVSAAHLRGLIEQTMQDGHSAEYAVALALGWLQDIREACGVEACGHA